jgi:hypothetical protein
MGYFQIKDDDVRIESVDLLPDIENIGIDANQGYLRAVCQAYGRTLSEKGIPQDYNQRLISHSPLLRLSCSARFYWHSTKRGSFSY